MLCLHPLPAFATIVAYLYSHTKLKMLILIAIWILYEAVQRFQHLEPMQPLVMLLSAGVGIIVNLFN